MRASRSRTREHTNLLTATPDEAALAIACFLLTARDLLCPQLACRRFGLKDIVSGDRDTDSLRGTRVGAGSVGGGGLANRRQADSTIVGPASYG